MEDFIFRALLTIGYMFLSSWAGTEVCAPDIMLWNILFVILNLTHTLLLTWRFLPPTLTLELTELYLKVSRSKFAVESNCLFSGFFFLFLIDKDVLIFRYLNR